MARRITVGVLVFLLLAPAAWASVSMEELQEAQKKIMARELNKEEARQEKLAQASEALRNKDFERAISLASDIIAQHQPKGPNKAEVLVLRALAYFHKGDLAKSKADLDDALSNNRQEARAYAMRSAIHEKENRREPAIADLEAYLALRPQDQEGQARLQKLKGQAPAPDYSALAPAAPVSPVKPPAPATTPAPAAAAPAPRPAPAAAAQPLANPELKLYVARDQSYALHKPANWLVQEDARADSLRITVIAPDQSAAVDFLWLRNPRGQANALLALEAYRQRLAPSGAAVTWKEVYRSGDNAKARAALEYSTPQMALQGTFYGEASPKALFAQGYLARAGQLERQRPLLFNIMASLAFSKRPAAPAPAAAFQPQYVSAQLVGRRAPDGSLSMSTPQDWGFAAAKGTVVTGAPNGGSGFAFLVLSGNPMLPRASVAQGVIGQRYLPPAQALKVILAGFGHRNIAIQQQQPDPASSQEFATRVGRRGDAQDVVATWTSAKGSACQGFFKVICAAPSPTGMWFCQLAGVWGPQQDFYRYWPMLEQVASSFSINDQFARRYIQDGLKRARELHDKTVAMMRDNARGREQQQAAWEAQQKRKEFTDSKWDDYRRGNSYWVSDLENGKVYRSDSHGLRDTGGGDYYEGRGYNYTNFEGRNPRHPSETMREVSSYELQQMQGR